MLSKKDREILAECVATVAGAAAKAARASVGSRTIVGDSQVAVHLASELNVPSHGNFPIVNEAFVDAMFATVAGIDHAKSWVGLLNAGSATVTMGTVARGALEGLAKAWSLMSARDTAELIQRHLASVRFDLTYPLKHSQFEDWSGSRIDKVQFPKVHDAIERDLGLSRVRRPGFNHLVAELLTAGMKPGLKANPEIYSQLSGSAHAGMSALGMYVVPQTSEFELPRIIAAEQAGYLFAGTCVVAEAWLSIYKASDAEAMDWRRTRARAAPLMSQVADWY